MTNNEFKDCEFRFLDEDEGLCCKNKTGVDLRCDNCTQNIHLNCENYNPKRDMCLKWFESNVSESYKECHEKTIANDKNLQRKWSN